MRNSLPQLVGVRVRRRSGAFEITGRLIRPMPAAVRRGRAMLDLAWVGAYNMRKETHGTAIPFLVAMARARSACPPGQTVLRVDGRRVGVAPDGTFRVRAARPRSLRANTVGGGTTGMRLSGPLNELPPRLTPGDRRVRAQIETRVAGFVNALRRERVGPLGRLFDPGYQSPHGTTHSSLVAAWDSVFRASSIERVRFRLEAFDPGDRLCGGPVAVSIPWTASGRLPLSVPFVEGGGGRQAMGERAVYLFANRGTRAKPDWRIVWGTSASTNRF
jgi:hypothetical protein